MMEDCTEADFTFLRDFEGLDKLSVVVQSCSLRKWRDFDIRIGNTRGPVMLETDIRKWLENKLHMNVGANVAISVDIKGHRWD